MCTRASFRHKERKTPGLHRTLSSSMALVILVFVSLGSASENKSIDDAVQVLYQQQKRQKQ